MLGNVQAEEIKKIVFFRSSVRRQLLHSKFLFENSKSIFFVQIIFGKSHSWKQISAKDICITFVQYCTTAYNLYQRLNLYSESLQNYLPC